MLAVSNILFLFTLALSVSGLVTPHVVRSPHGHRAIAARMAAPVASPAVGPYGTEVKITKPRKMRRRGDTGRCKPQTSSASATPSSSLSTFIPSSSSSTPVPSSSSSTPQPTSSQDDPALAPANVGSSPSSSSDPQTPTSTSTPTSTPEPQTEPSTSSDTPAPASTSTTSTDSGSSSSSSDSSTPSFLQGTQSGQATYYDIGLGACGVTNSGNDKIAAVSKLLFDAFPGYDGTNSNTNPVCGKSVTLSYNGKSTTVKIEDRCEACAITDLDLSQAAFDDLADESLGRIDMTWVWDD